MQSMSQIQFAAPVAAFVFGFLFPMLPRKSSPLLATFPGDSVLLWIVVGICCSLFAAIALSIGMLLTRGLPPLYKTFEWFAVLLPAAGAGVLLSVVLSLLGLVWIVDPRSFAVLASSWLCAGISALTVRAWLLRQATV
jgi:hypothetical protein